MPKHKCIRQNSSWPMLNSVGQDRRAITQTNVLHCTWTNVFICMWMAFYNFTGSSSTIILLNSKGQIVSIIKSGLGLLNKSHILKGKSPQWIKESPKLSPSYVLVGMERLLRLQQSTDMRGAGSQK